MGWDRILSMGVIVAKIANEIDGDVTVQAGKYENEYAIEYTHRRLTKMFIVDADTLLSEDPESIALKALSE